MLAPNPDKCTQMFPELDQLASQHEYTIDWAKSWLVPVKAGCIQKENQPPPSYLEVSGFKYRGGKTCAVL